MTLNITLASSWLMLQSSDFRLTANGTLVSEVAQKQVVLHYKNWSGLLCYAGIAKQAKHDTEKWLSHILTHDGGERTVKEVLSTIVEEGNEWLVKIPSQDRQHTFTLIAYVEKTPHIYLISNFQWVGGRKFAQPLDEFRVDHSKPRKPKCLVTGSGSNVITSEQSRKLEIALASTTVNSREALERMRYDVASVSRAIAKDSRSKNTIGENCMVAHLLPDGSGEAQVFGNLDTEFLPTLITHGMNQKPIIPKILNDAGDVQPHRLVGVTWTANGPETVMLGAYRAIANQTGDGWPSLP